MKRRGQVLWGFGHTQHLLVSDPSGNRGVSRLVSLAPSPVTQMLASKTFLIYTSALEIKAFPQVLSH